MARPCKLTDEVRARIVEAIEKGQSREAAAACAGIGSRTLYEWLAWGRQGQEPYAQLTQDLQKAEGRCEAAIVDAIREAGMKNSWQALAWLAERKWPQRFANRAIVEIKVKAEFEQFFTILRDRLPADVFAQVLDVAVNYTDDDTAEALALPAAEVLAIEAADPAE